MHRFDLHQPDSDKIKVSVAVVLPHSMFKQREYKKIIGQSALKLHGSYFEKMFDLSPYLEMMQPIPAPTEVLGKICDQVRIPFFKKKSYNMEQNIETNPCPRCSLFGHIISGSHHYR